MAITPEPDPPLLVELDTLFEFEAPAGAGDGATFVVSLATLLQCLCIAEQRFLVPPLDPDWEARTIPPTLRARSRVNPVIG
ncbi:MAG: hypothetical protein KDI44_16390 [Thiothrix sp.]|nr:hypothetical protein [Thiothrix sp.]